MKGWDFLWSTSGIISGDFSLLISVFVQISLKQRDHKVNRMFIETSFQKKKNAKENQNIFTLREWTQIVTLNCIKSRGAIEPADRGTRRSSLCVCVCMERVKKRFKVKTAVVKRFSFVHVLNNPSHCLDAGWSDAKMQSDVIQNCTVPAYTGAHIYRELF